MAHSAALSGDEGDWTGAVATHRAGAVFSASCFFDDDALRGQMAAM